MEQASLLRRLRLLYRLRGVSVSLTLIALVLLSPTSGSPWFWPVLLLVIAGFALMLVSLVGAAKAAADHFFCPHCGAASSYFADAWLLQEPFVQCNHCQAWIPLEQIDVHPRELRRPAPARREIEPESLRRGLRRLRLLYLLRGLVLAAGLIAILLFPQPGPLLIGVALAVLLVHQLLTERFDRVAQHSFQCPHCGFSSAAFARRAAGFSSRKECPYCKKPFSLPRTKHTDNKNGTVK